MDILHTNMVAKNSAPRPKELSISEKIRNWTQLDSSKSAVLSLTSDGTSIARTISREELGELADKIASSLLDVGVAIDDPILICSNRTPEMIAAMIGVLRAGGIFVPIDADFPARRIAQMIKILGGRPKALVDAIGTEALQDHAIDTIDINTIVNKTKPNLQRAPERGPQDAAYIMFTSGSTGTPKGVTVPQRAIQRLVLGADFISIDQDTVTLQLAPVAFDASTLEIWAPLLNGGTIVLYPGGTAPDIDVLETVLGNHGITTLWLTSSLFNLIVDCRVEILKNIPELLVGGEALSVQHIATAIAKLPNTQLINGYGPTENTTFTCCYRIPRDFDQNDPHGIPIGRAISGTQVLICNELGKPVTKGEEGELIACGDGVALGYWKQTKLTDERFPRDPDATDKAGSIRRRYHTGDRVCIGGDGLIRFLGRIDDQIKIDGHRVELGEIQTLLRQQPEVRDAIAMVREDQPGNRRIIAYVEAKSKIEGSSLRGRLASELPAAEVPSQVVVMDKLPLSPIGKIDRQALPAPEITQKRTPKQSGLSKTEQQIQRIWTQLLGIEGLGRNDDFFQLGGTSMLALRFIEQWRREGNIPIPVARMYDGASAARIAKFIDNANAQPEKPAVKQEKVTDGKIAIVGMAGRFPGAGSVEALWQMLIEGNEGTSFFSKDELDPSIADTSRNDPAYVSARGILPDIEDFDCQRFGISAREAALLDPQQRLLLEIAWDTLESAGCDPERYAGVVGVWAGTRTGDYLQQLLQTRPDVVERSGIFQVTLANDKDFAANRIAYLLGLTGPAIAVYSACSTSLVAVHQAARGLLNHECDLALAGGAAVTIPQRVGHIHQEGDILSADGHCRAFDAKATGTLFNDGVAMVALKRLSDAQADGDQIHAVLLGSAVNNDGSEKASFMAPSPEGQSKVVARAIENASVSVESIGFIEAHGTATPLGDPVEVDALLRVFGRAETPSCVISSIKSNIGHLTAAAGVTGLIKAALSVRDGVIPPTLHFTQANPLLDLGGRFLVSSSAEHYRPDGPRRAGISSFGVGGTNAHVVLEQPPASVANRNEPGLLKTPLLCVSAPTTDALDRLQNNLVDHLESNPNIEIEDVAWTLQTTRYRWPVRRSIAGADREHCITTLGTKPGNAGISSGEASQDARSPVFVFPGQSSQYVGMGSGLARQEPLFAKHLGSCADALGTFGDGITLNTLLNYETGAELLSATQYAQPALFAIEYALARSWIDLGVQPAWMLGHSIGEFVAACISGVFSLEDALALVTARGEIMDRMPKGEMLSIRATAKSLDIPDTLDLAAINGTALCVVAGKSEAIANFADTLDSGKILNKRIRTSHAFHSRLMEPAVAEFHKIVEATEKNSDMRIPILSTVTGKALTPEQAVDSEYWSRHLRVPVRFADAAKAIAAELDGELSWFECGPGSGAIATMVCASLSDSKNRNDAFIKGLSVGNKVTADNLAKHEPVEFAASVGAAWCAGHDVPSESALGKYHRVSLPSTPFARKRAWLLDTPPADSNNTLENTATKNPIHIQTHQTMNIPSLSSSANGVVPQVCELLADLSGEDIEVANADNNFLELGFDSLLLTQAASAVRKEFGVDVSFRELNEDFTTPRALAEHLQASGVEPEAIDSPLDLAPVDSPAQQTMDIPVPPIQSDAANNLMLNTMQQQLILLQQQFVALTGVGLAPQAPAQKACTSASPDVKKIETGTKNITKPQEKISTQKAPAKAHGPQLVIKTGQGSRLTKRQESHLDQLIEDYSKHSAGSKQFTQDNRANLADPRTAAGFSSRLKEITYPTVIASSSGCHLTDIDGNEYVDMLSGFGSNFFGFGVPFVREAVTKQMDKGMEIGPQSELVAQACDLFQQLVPSERVAFCNTGSEAVLASIRLARTVTGRDLIIVFSGGYHGIFDEVVARPTPRGSRPAAPGIPQGAVDNIMVLPWADPESIDTIRSKANDIAAVLVEPVQSRDPATQPKEFLQQLRTLTEEIDSALIFDEVVCGFRVAQGGAQQHFGIQADIGTYGKVVGGGVPIGVVAGKRKFMDALDGGHWRYGDNSNPTVGVTYFAGTFVRHPPALAAAIACMKYMLEQGPELQQSVDLKTKQLVTRLNELFTRTAAPIKVKYFSSILRFDVDDTVPQGEIFYHHLRRRGVHIQIARPAFMTVAHTEEDLNFIIAAFTDVIADMQAGGFFPEQIHQTDLDSPPEPGAKLGRDPDGNPTWYVKDASEPSGYRALVEQVVEQ